MKKLLIIIICLNAIGVSAQVKNNDLKGIQTKLEEIQNYTNNGDWTGLVNSMYPPFFDGISQEEIRKSMEQMETMGMKMTMSDMKIGEVQFIDEVDSERFFYIPLFVKSSISFTSEEMKQPAMIEMLKSQFEAQSGTKDVEYDEETASFMFSQDKIMVGINDTEKAKWYTVDYNPASANMMLGEILPEAILKKMELLTKSF